MVTVNKIIKSVIVLLVLTAGITISPGCTENNTLPVNAPEFSSGHDHAGKTLLWEHNGLAVNANGERIVNDEISCNLQGLFYNNILIEFDGFTNADTTLYVSQVTVEIDGEAVLIENGEQYINRHHEINIENIQSCRVRFYIALWCDEIVCSSSAKLEISNLKIYNY